MMLRNSQTTLFSAEGNKVVINPKALLIPEFNDIYQEDKSKEKKKALKEFAYMYYVADYSSEYNAYGLGKETQIGIDIFMNRNYKPDPILQRAIDKYQKLQETPSMQYLIAIRNRVQRVIQFLDNAEIVEKENKEGDIKYKNPFVTIEKVTKVFNELEDVIEKLEKWEKKVFEEEEDMKIRGGGMLNIFEDPSKADWLRK